MLLDMNAVLGSCKYGKCVRCTFDSSVYCLYLYALRHCWALSIRILICHRLSVLDRGVQTQAISDHFLWQNDQMVRLGYFTNTSANPFSAEESARPSSPTTTTTTPPPARRRRRRRAGAATVFPAWHEDLRVPLGTWMHISANSAEPHISGSAHSGSGGWCHTPHGRQHARVAPMWASASAAAERRRMYSAKPGLGASDHFIWQNARMFRLEFFAITVLPP